MFTMPVHPTVALADASNTTQSFEQRRRVASRIFRGALLFNGGLTVSWAILTVTGIETPFLGAARLDASAVGRVLFGILIFHVLWGLVWYGVKAALLKYVAGFTKDERRAAFSSRMSRPYDVSAIVAAHSERRIRIIDMIGRRGRFITIALAAFFYLYGVVARERPETFATLFLQGTLFEALLASWTFLAFFYSDGVVAGALYGPQSRIMDGVLARANCLLILTLWTCFRFFMIPIGSRLAILFPPEQFAVVFALIWGSYIVTDALTEVGGAIFGRQTIRVRGIGDVNRKSVGGTVTGFVACLLFCSTIVTIHQLPASWLVLAVIVAVSNTVLELYSPRGTDDLVMATGNALICWAFGALVAA
jgi:hypothetical protein